MNRFKQLGYAFALIAVMVIAGCSTPKSEPVYSDVPGSSSATASDHSVPQDVPPTVTKAAPVSVEPKPVQPKPIQPVESKPELIVTPDNSLTGTIVSVNDVGRFVVLRFPLGRLPAVDAKLFVYRQGLKVAELKVTGPNKDDHTVADIRSGDCRVNDEVRDR